MDCLFDLINVHNIYFVNFFCGSLDIEIKNIKVQADKWKKKDFGVNKTVYNKISSKIIVQ